MTILLQERSPCGADSRGRLDFYHSHRELEVAMGIEYKSVTSPRPECLRRALAGIHTFCDESTDL